MSNTLQPSWDASLNPEERTQYNKLFDSTSTDGHTITGEQAAALFAHSKLSAQALGQANERNAGVLDKQGFFIALKLIACAQHGIRPSAKALSSKTPLPMLQPDTHETAQDTDVISPSDRIKYVRIFKALEPVNGFIRDEKARTVFMRSKLPGGTLGHIWNLSHKNQSDLMSQSEFVIAMHYIARCMAGVKQLPDVIPQSVIASASSKPPPPPKRKERHSMIQPKEVSSPKKETSPRSVPKPPVPLMKMNEPWNVDAIEKEQYKVAFDKLNINNREYIDGSEAVNYFKSSHLSESELGLIWDLADTQNRGCLSLKEFIIAMHLIRVRKEGYAIPPKLSDSLLASVEDLDRVSSSKRVEIPIPEQPTIPEEPEIEETTDSDSETSEEEDKKHTTEQLVAAPLPTTNLPLSDERDRSRIVDHSSKLDEENSELSNLQTSLDQTRSRTAHLLQKEGDLIEDLKRVSSEKIRVQKELEEAENEERVLQERISTLEKECETMRTELALISKASEDQEIKTGERQSELLAVKDKHTSLNAQLEKAHAHESTSSKTVDIVSPPTQKATPPPPPPPKSRMQRNSSILGEGLTKSQSVRRRAPAPTPIKRQPSSVKSPQAEEASAKSDESVLGSTFAPVAAAAATATAAFATAVSFINGEDKDEEVSREIEKKDAEPSAEPSSTEPTQTTKVGPIQSQAKLAEEPKTESAQKPQFDSVQTPQVVPVPEYQVESAQVPQVELNSIHESSVDPFTLNNETNQATDAGDTYPDKNMQEVDDHAVETAADNRHTMTEDEISAGSISELRQEESNEQPQKSEDRTENLPLKETALEQNNIHQDVIGGQNSVQEEPVPKEIPVEVFPVTDDDTENKILNIQPIENTENVDTPTPANIDFEQPSGVTYQNNDVLQEDELPVREPTIEKGATSTVYPPAESSYKTNSVYTDSNQYSDNVPQSYMEQTTPEELGSQQTTILDDKPDVKNDHVLAEPTSTSNVIKDVSSNSSITSEESDEESIASEDKPLSNEIGTFGVSNTSHHDSENIDQNDTLPAYTADTSNDSIAPQNMLIKEVSSADNSSPFEQENTVAETGKPAAESDNERSDTESEENFREYSTFTPGQYANDTSGIDVLASHQEEFGQSNSESSKTTEHDFEVVDNASVASSFVSAHTGDFTSHHGSLDEFDLTSFGANDPKVKSTNTTPDKEISAFEAEFDDMVDSDDNYENPTNLSQTAHIDENPFDVSSEIEDKAEKTPTLSQPEPATFSDNFVPPEPSTETSTTTSGGHKSVLKGFEGFPFAFGDTEEPKPSTTNSQQKDISTQPQSSQPIEQSPPVEQSQFSTQTPTEQKLYSPQPEQTRPSSNSINTTPENTSGFASSVHNSINHASESINTPSVHTLAPKESEYVGVLMSMGFTVDQAKDALRRYDNDLQKATNFLLDQY
ncbi:hypothetical protein PHYBLDRAFT_180891 [Phycomyces blakesleeanus NRRL 1555(-)]|uniref:Uncharacterized protein n=2 Tax=Phycomyces blakesleeanus TaxID=4837 RepID=A0A162PW15_PHYB8|nr:hypothetical protein PHYBLDRAFT_180891 [Phycomyces blakesleeanus NRRL 1555(-)]OAD74636.1 hypothetical protein PHYBLDRAFT_180891 [Phycomyces blakesleeanus NRRL 1555(-)]|eukprot:XP_018292676.1 hypothetical protein PHYBLDRAFT_180891 [Phycomyces blakesleeanus NRRL 1555(-)]